MMGRATTLRIVKLGEQLGGTPVDRSDAAATLLELLLAQDLVEVSYLVVPVPTLYIQVGRAALPV